MTATAAIRASKSHWWRICPTAPSRFVVALVAGTVLNYVVGVETTNGTKNPVTITDTLNKGNSEMYKLLGTYITDSFVLYKVDAQGTLTKQTTFPTYTLTEGTDTKTVKIENLPALNAGEKYLWCYSVLFDSRSFNNSEDGTGIIINRAVAYVDDLKDAGYFQTLTMEQARITKKGEYKPEDGQIEWKITVSVPNPVITGNFLVGYVVKDDLPEGVQIVGKVNVGGTLIDAEEFLNNGKGYTITSADMNGRSKLEITFRTTTPIGGGDVTNTATASKDGKTFTASDTVPLKQGDWSLSKLPPGARRPPGTSRPPTRPVKRSLPCGMCWTTLRTTKERKKRTPTMPLQKSWMTPSRPI